MMTWYTADLHFGHERIVELCHRPFATVEEMNDALVYNWNSVVAPEDHVHVLGDFAMGERHLHHVSRLNGIKILTAGNHDNCWSYHKRWRAAMLRYKAAGFHYVYPDGYMPFNYLHSDFPNPEARRVDLSHLPWRGTGDHTFVERYSEQRWPETERDLLCGHVHDAWKVKRAPGGHLMVNVGVDVWDFTPVSSETIAGVLDGAA